MTLTNSSFNNSLLPYHYGPLRVTLFGCAQPALADQAQALDHGAATFLFEGIVRACTHQLVCHRRASYSQKSQRYVDMSKGDWQALIPPAVAENPAAVVLDFWRHAEERYGICVGSAFARKTPVSCRPMRRRRAS